MTTTEIKNWLNYWQNSKMVNLDAITSFDRVYQARKYCQCMRVGVFSDVTDLQIWNAIRTLKGDQ